MGVRFLVTPRVGWQSQRPPSARNHGFETPCHVRSLSSCPNSQTNEEHAHVFRLFVACATTIFVGTTSVVAANVTFLDEGDEEASARPSPSSPPPHAHAAEEPMVEPIKGESEKQEGNEEDEDDDPYANLPEEDEPTDCSMCNTFRQGPCRTTWRKLERCFKDHEEEQNGAQKCMRYFLPHQKCLMNYTNLYSLVRLTNLQEYIDETEKTLPTNQRREMDELPDIDWSLWEQFIQDVGPHFTQGLSTSVSKDTPLWKRFPPDTEPVVLTFSTQIPRQDKAGLVLRFAYVVDQDGMVLGVESNEIYRKLKDQAEGRVREQSSTDNEDTETPGPHVNLEFHVVPSITQNIQVKAMYAMDPTMPELADDGKDDLLKESSYVELGVNPSASDRL